jgi:intracellular septation protein
MSADRYRAMNPMVRLAVEVGPLVIFFAVNSWQGIYAATGTFMVAVVVAVAVPYATVRHLPTLPLVSAALVLVFGGLTLYLQDEVFIKIKPTLINALFGVIVLGGLALGKNFVRSVMGTMTDLTDEGWRLLARRWGWFFLALAVLNEIVWRSVSTDTWVSFKVFGLLPLTLVFAMAQVPLMQRHARHDAPAPAADQIERGNDPGA